MLASRRAHERIRSGAATPTAGWAEGYAPGHMFITDVPDASYRLR
ncbi:MAG: hypothetical protein ACRDRL_13005 [Sciscionella sp.]